MVDLQVFLTSRISMPRIKESYEIATKTEEPERIFIISVEGTKTEVRYLKLLQREYNLNVRFKFEISPARDEPGFSSDPVGVLRRLKEKKKKY